MNRYMVLCDALDARTPLDELVDLFTKDAVWQGIGQKYRGTYGEIRGREALRLGLALAGVGRGVVVARPDQQPNWRLIALGYHRCCLPICTTAPHE